MDVAGIKKVLGLVVVLALASCGKEEKIPEGIMSEKEMISILIDIRLAEGQIATLTLRTDSANVLFAELEKDIFETYGVDSATYTKSYQYYLLQPEKAIYITDAVIDSLKVRKDLKEGRPKKDK